MIVTKFDFSKGAVHDFGQKFEISSLYFGKIGLEIVLGDILDTKQAFLNCKNIDLDRGWLAKIFSFFLLKKISLEKMFCDSFDKKPIKVLKILILHGHQTGFFPRG